MTPQEASEELKEEFEIFKNGIHKADWENPNEELRKIIEANTMAIEILGQQPCEDCISREAVLDTEYQIKEINGIEYVMLSEVQMKIRKMPSVTPKYTDEEIDKAQAVEQAYVNKMVELAVKETERPKGKWIQTKDDCDGVNFYDFSFKCSKCGKEQSFKSNYCPNCGVDMKEGDK